MGDILASVFGTSEPWQGFYWLINLCAALFSTAFATVLFFRCPSRLVRPSFMVAVLLMVFYGWSLVPYSFVFYERNFDIWWFSASIHGAVLLNLLWVKYTPKLNCDTIYKKPSGNGSLSFNSFELWFSVVLFFVLLSAYLYRVPPTCTALYSIFFDPSLALLIREMSVKLVGTGYSTYALSILATTITPIVAFLSIHMMYKMLRAGRLLWVVFWFVILSLAFISTLLSGAKGNLIPTFVAISVAGFLSAYRWYWRISLVIALNAMLIIILSLFGMERASMNAHERKDYKFGQCVVKLDICEPTRVLLKSLTARDFSLDLPKSTILSLEKERQRYCDVSASDFPTANISTAALSRTMSSLAPASGKGDMSQFSPVNNDEVSLKSENPVSNNGATLIEPDSEKTGTFQPSLSQPTIAGKVNLGSKEAVSDKLIENDSVENDMTPEAAQQTLKPVPTRSVRSTEALTENEKLIVSEHAKAKVWDRINGIINRAFVTPLIVAHWHFLYVSEHESPGFLGISIARRFSDDYVDMPGKVCEVYEFIRSGGDKTSTCAAPTSYLFTYPAYMGILGLLLACLLTIGFDLVVSLVIRNSVVPLNYLGVGLAAVAGINFMTADFTTVMLSHGAGPAFALLVFFCLCRYVVGKRKSS